MTCCAKSGVIIHLNAARTARSFWLWGEQIMKQKRSNCSLQLLHPVFFSPVTLPDGCRGKENKPVPLVVVPTKSGFCLANTASLLCDLFLVLEKLHFCLQFSFSSGPLKIVPHANKVEEQEQTLSWQRKFPLNDRRSSQDGQQKCTIGQSSSQRTTFYKEEQDVVSSFANNRNFSSLPATPSLFCGPKTVFSGNVLATKWLQQCQPIL